MFSVDVVWGQQIELLPLLQQCAHPLDRIDSGQDRPSLSLRCATSCRGG
jgi:hypothetical protein